VKRFFTAMMRTLMAARVQLFVKILLLCTTYVRHKVNRKPRARSTATKPHLSVQSPVPQYGVHRIIHGISFSTKKGSLHASTTYRYVPALHRRMMHSLFGVRSRANIQLAGQQCACVLLTETVASYQNWVGEGGKNQGGEKIGNPAFRHLALTPVFMFRNTYCIYTQERKEEK
jgi:hypothetical protein